MHGSPPDRWVVRYGRLAFELKRTEFGHVGIFPEQAENWDWIADQVNRAAVNLEIDGRLAGLDPINILNLFAYTGGSTLAAAAAGARVTHVDAASNVVAWARRNAGLSGLGDAPIRWIADDAVKFVTREIRRGNRYDGVVLDPPSYGHGTRGEAWRLAEDLPRLLTLCAELTGRQSRLRAGRLQFVLLTCHTQGFTPQVLRELLASSFAAVHVEAAPLVLSTSAGRTLPSGTMARYAK